MSLVRALAAQAAALRVLAVRAWRADRLFLLALAPAVLLRALAEVGYQWQLWFNDSFDYIQHTVTFQLDAARISGYSVFLKVLEPLRSYFYITFLQHLLGVGVAVLIYVLARYRFRVRPWLAVLATLPVLYDGFEIQLEHLIMADTIFLFLVMAAVTVLLWTPEAAPSWRRCAVAGALLGVSDLFRSVGLPLLAVFAVYLIIRWAPWRRIAALVATCLLPVALYAGAFWVQHGQFAMTDSTGVFLYSRVMTFAECSKMGQMPADELALCTTVPPAKRGLAQNYIWRDWSPLDRYPGSKFSPVTNQVAESFAIRAIEHQPLSYLHTVYEDTVRAFWLRHPVFPNWYTYREYLFSAHPETVPAYAHHKIGPYTSWAAAYNHGNPETHLVQPVAGWLASYQRRIWLPGTGFGLILLAGLTAIGLAWRRLGGPALLPWVTSAALIVVPAATAEFDYRYVLTATPFACLAVALGYAPGTAGDRVARSLFSRLRSSRASRRPSPDTTSVTSPRTSA